MWLVIPAQKHVTAQWEFANRVWQIWSDPFWVPVHDWPFGEKGVGLLYLLTHSSAPLNGERYCAGNVSQKTGPVSSELIRKRFCSECAREDFDPKAWKRIFRRMTQRGFCTAAWVLWDFPPEHFTIKERKFCVDVVEVLLYVHINRRFIRDGGPGRPPRLSHSSWALNSVMVTQSLMSSDVGLTLLGTNSDHCVSMIQCCFTSTETVRFIRTESPGRPPRLSHSSWTLM